MGKTGKINKYPRLKKFGKEELDYTWNTPIIDKVDLDDKSDDFDGDKAKPSHFYNQLVKYHKERNLLLKPHANCYQYRIGHSRSANKDYV